MNAAISAVNTKLLVAIIGLLVGLIGIGGKFIYDQRQVAILLQAQAAKQAEEGATARAQDEAIKAELQRRSERSRSSGKSKFEFNSWPQK